MMRREVKELNELDDVNAPSPSDNDALVWDDASQKWIPEANILAETDPVFGASPAAGITASDITNWRTRAALIWLGV